jgi:hypothetical protein
MSRSAGCNTGVTNERYFSHFARSYLCRRISTRALRFMGWRAWGREHDYEQRSRNNRSLRDYAARGRNECCPWRRLFRYRPGGPVGTIGPTMGSSEPTLADRRAVDARRAPRTGELAGDCRVFRRQLAPQSPQRHTGGGARRPGGLCHSRQRCWQQRRRGHGTDRRRHVGRDGQVHPPLSTSAGSSASARARLPSIGMRLISLP